MMGKNTRARRSIPIKMSQNGGVLRRKPPFCRHAAHVINVAGEVNLRIQPLNLEGQLVEHAYLLKAQNRSSNRTIYSEAQAFRIASVKIKTSRGQGHLLQRYFAATVVREASDLRGRNVLDDEILIRRGGALWSWLNGSSRSLCGPPCFHRFRKLRATFG